MDVLRGACARWVRAAACTAGVYCGCLPIGGWGQELIPDAGLAMPGSDSQAADPADPAPFDEACDGYCSCQCCEPSYGLCDSICGLIQPSDHCYDSFISPMTNPVYFEDPRNLTEARLIFLNHKVPLNAGGGDIQVYALQVRAALTDRLSLIATKDGYIVSSNSVVDDGWADIAAGLKYQIFADPSTQRLLAGGVVYELPTGTPDARQGNGGGAFDLFLSGGAQICRDGHWLSGLGIVLPADRSEESTWWYWSNHVDYELGHGFYALAEVNWYHWLRSGDNGIPGIEGGDLFNFGSTGVAGNDIVTGAFGMKFKPGRDMEIGVAWELPLTERRDVLENRLTVDFIKRF